MNRRVVLADSSAWIAHLTHGPATCALDLLLAQHRVAVNTVIRVEVLTGARDETQYAALDEELRGLHVLPLTEPVWRLAERMRFQLKRHGYLMTVADVVIASCAMVHNCELLHRDEHFNVIARHSPLKMYQHSGKVRR